MPGNYMPPPPLLTKIYRRNVLIVTRAINGGVDILGVPVVSTRATNVIYRRRWPHLPQCCSMVAWQHVATQSIALTTPAPLYRLALAACLPLAQEPAAGPQR